MLWWTLRQLKSADEAKRLEAARRLGRSADARASEYLISLLADASTEVRAAAANSLGRLGEKRAMEPLLKLLDANPTWPVRQNAITALASLGDPQVAKAIVPYVEHGIAEIREAALEALVKLDPPDVNVKQLLSEYHRREAAQRLSEEAKAKALANQLTLEEALVFLDRRMDLMPSHHATVMELLKNVRRELQPARGQRINVQPGDEMLVATLSMLILSLVFHGEFKGIIIANSSASASDFFKKPVLQKLSADALAQLCGKSLVNANQLVKSSGCVGGGAW